MARMRHFDLGEKHGIVSCQYRDEDSQVIGMENFQIRLAVVSPEGSRLLAQV